MQTPERFLTLEPRALTEDERGLLTHITRWGSDGYPVSKVGSRHWSWSFRSLSSPRVFPTKREATASFERFYDLLIELHAYESWQRAVAERDAREAS